MFKLKEDWPLLLWISPLIAAVILPFACTVGGCVNDHPRELAGGKYEYVKTAAGDKLKKVQLFCPGKTLTYVATDVSIYSSGTAEFKDYMTNERIYTCDR